MNSVIAYMLLNFLLWLSSVIVIGSKFFIRRRKRHVLFRIGYALILEILSIKTGSKILIVIFSLNLVFEILNLVMDKIIKKQEQKIQRQNEEIKNVKEGVVYTLSEDDYKELE